MSRYIDADEVLEQIRKKLGIKSLSYLLEAERQIVDAIQSAPSIDTEPKRGRWIPVDNGHHVRCSECGRCGFASDNFCSNCGVDMRGDDNEAD